MNPLISTILLWERRLELGHHQAHHARRDRFENRVSPTPGAGGTAAADSGAGITAPADHVRVPARDRGDGSQPSASGSG